MSDSRARLLSVMLALLVVSSGVAPIATASHNETETCTNKDALIFGFTFGQTNEHCDTDAQVAAAVHAVETAEDNQTEADLYNAGLAQEAEAQTHGAVLDNYLQDTEAVAWMKAEAAIAEAYEAGKTESQAKAAAREAIADYYTVRQKNILESWNNSITTFVTLQERAKMEGLGDDFVTYQNATTYNAVSPQTLTLAETNESVTLVDGNTTTAIGIDSEVDWSGFNGGVQLTGPSMGSTTVGPDGAPYTEDIDQLVVRVPSDNYNASDRAVLLDLRDYRDRWTTVVNKNDALQNEVDTFVNATYDDFQSGQINSTDVLSRTTTMTEYGTAGSANSTGMWDVVAATAAMGLETPDLNGTGMMTVSQGQNNYTGVLLARNAPNGSWTVGQTYDPANIDGPVMIATTEGVRKDLDSSFTLESATDKNGNSLDSVDTTEVVYKTSNTTQLLERMDKVLAYQQEIEDRQQSYGGGTTGDDGSLNTEAIVIIGAAALIGGAYLARRED